MKEHGKIYEKILRRGHTRFVPVIFIPDLRFLQVFFSCIQLFAYAGRLSQCGQKIVFLRHINKKKGGIPMKCYSCMRNVADTERICPHCGAKLVMDQELLEQAQNGDSCTMAILYSMAYEPMYYAANEVLHNEADAEDAAMDAVETMLKKVGQLEKPESFITWAKQIAVNKAKDYVKKKKPILIGDLEDSETSGFWQNLEDVDRRNMPEFHLERRETIRLIRNAAKALGEDLYIVLECVYADGMKLAEISEKLGVNLNTIKTRKRTAERRLYAWAMEQEKKGLYLHGLSPIEFWLWLYQ